MTQATTTTAAATNGNGKREAKGPPTAIEAITKVTKILDQLSPADRKRVLAFVNESSNPSNE